MLGEQIEYNEKRSIKLLKRRQLCDQENASVKAKMEDDKRKNRQKI
jgi:hypothetical protein